MSHLLWALGIKLQSFYKNGKSSELWSLSSALVIALVCLLWLKLVLVLSLYRLNCRIAKKVAIKDIEFLFKSLVTLILPLIVTILVSLFTLLQ